MKKFQFYHGAALTKIIHSNHFEKIQIFSKNNSSYLVDGKIGIYIKYSQKRIYPWIFTFAKEHILEVKEVFDLLGNVFVTLVCHYNGICCINWQEFCKIVSIGNNIYPKWIKASRNKNEKYTIYGIDGELNYKIGNSDFPCKLKDYGTKN